MKENKFVHRLQLMPIAFAICLGFASSTSRAGVLLQGFFWDAPSTPTNAWWDLLASRAHDLSMSGFTAVWIPPVLKGATGGYSDGYDPFDDYDLGSKDQRGTVPTHWGTRQQLTRAIGMMRANGMQVYVDNVLAQRNGDGGDRQFVYKDAFNQMGGGRFAKHPDFFWANDNGFGRALNQDKPEVKEDLKEAGDWLLRALGVQGVRIDFGLGVPTDFLSDYLRTGTAADKFVVSEYWSGDLNAVSNYVTNQMQGRVSVFDFALWGQLKDMANSNGTYDMRQLAGAGYVGRDPMHAVTFVENHDTDRSYPTRTNKHLGYAYILTSEGYPTVFWKDYFDYGMKPTIDPLVWIHEKLAGGPTQWRVSAVDHLVFERTGGRGLLVGINENQISWQSETVQTAFAPYTHLHDYTEHQADVQTDANGKVTILIGANNYVAYSPAGFGDPIARTGYPVTQELAGADDLDISPAKQNVFTQAGWVFVKGSSSMSWKLNFQSNGWLPSSRFNVRLSDIQGTVLTTQAYANLGVENQGSFAIPCDGWYLLSVDVENLKDSTEHVQYWLRPTYQAPEKF